MEREFLEYRPDDPKLVHSGGHPADQSGNKNQPELER